jgi:hypothetical protein
MEIAVGVSFGKHWPSFGQPQSYFSEASVAVLPATIMSFPSCPSETTPLQSASHQLALNQDPTSTAERQCHFNYDDTTSTTVTTASTSSTTFLFVIFISCGEIDNFLPMTLPTIPTLTSIQHSTIWCLSSCHGISTTRQTSTIIYLFHNYINVVKTNISETIFKIY